jgi:hypothetical protein
MAKIGPPPTRSTKGTPPSTQAQILIKYACAREQSDLSAVHRGIDARQYRYRGRSVLAQFPAKI